jgi:hypothetical protein
LTVRVTFRKAISDGNYGTELAEVSLEYECEPGQEQTEFAEALLVEARARVHAELGRSPSSTVRRAFEPPRRDEDKPMMPMPREEAFIHGVVKHQRHVFHVVEMPQAWPREEVL